MGVNKKRTNVMKKLMMLVLTACLVLPCFSILTHAADGRIMFTDPSTKVGETVEVKGVLEASSIEDRKIVMSYDTNMLKFKEGESVTETSSGQLTYEVSGYPETDGRAEFMMYFDVLKEGTAKIEVESCKAWTAGENYEEISCSSVGSSTITIEAGEATVDDPTDEPTDEPVDTPNQTDQVVVNGSTYTFSGDFAQADIPNGFTQTTIEYAGKTCNVVYNEKYGMYLGYLVDAEEKGEFFLYVEENATFAPYAEISISDSTSIILLSDVDGIRLPETYQVTTVLVNGVEFPAWQNSENSELCILYAVNSNGQKSLYQFDVSEGTYQKFEAPEVQEEEKNDSFIGKLSESLKEHLDMVILVSGVGFILFLVIIIILSVKLYNRNAELDEIYDEYGIDLEDEDDIVVQKDTKKNKKSHRDEEDDEEFFSAEADDEDLEISKADPEEFNEKEIVKLDNKQETVEQKTVDEEDDEDFSIDLSGILEDDSEEEKADDSKLDNKTLDNKESGLKNRAKTAIPAEEDFFDDDDDELGYEIDFIDLDD